MSVMIILYCVHDGLVSFRDKWIAFAIFKTVPTPPYSIQILVVHHTVYTLHAVCSLLLAIGLLNLLFGDITMDFQTFNKELALRTSVCAKKDLPQILHDFQHRHLTLCKLVNIYDYVFSPMVLALFCCGILVICLNLYISLLNPPMGALYWLFLVTPITLNMVGLMTFLSRMGTRLSDAVSTHTIQGCLIGVLPFPSSSFNVHNYLCSQWLYIP